MPSQEEETENETPGNSRNIDWKEFRVFKNLAVISLSNTLFSTAFNGISTLQSTINRENGTGVASLAILYGIAFVATILLPKVVIRRFGCKSTLTVSFLLFVPYMIYNFYPQWVILIPSSVIAGIASTLLWPTLTTYINRLSIVYTKQTGEDHLSINSLFFGIFGSIYSMTGIWGNLISFYVLDDPSKTTVPVTNTSSVCGINYCESQSVDGLITNLVEPDVSRRYILSGIYLALALLSVVLVGFLLDSLELGDSPRTLIVNDIKATFRVMVKPNQLLLLPLVVYTGLSQAFYYGDVTKAYIACSWGIYQVGAVSVCAAASGVVSMVIFGWLVKYTGQPLVICTSGAANIAVFIIWLTWRPSVETYYMLYVMSGLCGMYMLVIWIQLKSFYGVLFKGEEEAAYANDCLWNDMGLVIAYAFANYSCISTKIYALIGVFLISYCCYAIVEYRTYIKRRTVETS